ncbi:MAG: hypothetical protein WAT39_01690 [Planctomycetota bacterium]
MSPTTPPTPREPEIEALAKFARSGLWVLRRVFWCAGAFAIGWSLFAPGGAATGDSAGTTARFHVVWLCGGLPLVLPVGWLFGRGRWLALAAGVALWFLPSLLVAADPEYGFLLRMFASLVACATLLVWRTLWNLGSATGADGRSRD